MPCPLLPPTYLSLSPNAWRLVRTLALGQLISLLVSITGVCSGLLAARGISLPASQSVLNYYLLALCYGGYEVFRSWRAGRGGGGGAGGVGESDDAGGCCGRARGGAGWRAGRGSGGSNGGVGESDDVGGCCGRARGGAGAPWWSFAALALADVEANYLVVKAYSYTSMTSVMLIDSWSIVVAMALSAAFLHRRFSLRHGVGVMCCVAGLVVLALSDGGSGGDAGGRALWGDFLCLAAASLYGVSNVLQVRACARACAHAYMCVCARALVCVRACVYVCICVPVYA